MKRVTVLARVGVVLVGAALAVPTAAPARRHARQCAPASSSVLLSDAQAEVFIPPSGVGIEACMRSSRRTTTLEAARGTCATPAEDACGTVESKLLLGDVLAYTERRGGELLLIARRISDGRFLHRLKVEGGPTGTRVTALALNASGSLAWVQEEVLPRPGGGNLLTAYALYAVDSSGFRAVTGVVSEEPTGLHVSGNMLFWRIGSTQKSTHLK